MRTFLKRLKHRWDSLRFKIWQRVLIEKVKRLKSSFAYPLLVKLELECPVIFREYGLKATKRFIYDNIDPRPTPEQREAKCKQEAAARGFVEMELTQEEQELVKKGWGPVARGLSSYYQGERDSNDGSSAEPS